MKIIYLSITGQTKRFIQKVGMEALELTNQQYQFKMKQAYVLVVPTYDQEMTRIVNDFLEYNNNYQLCKGVVGSGNRNFADSFIYTAKNIAKRYDIPLLYGFECSGTNKDIDNFRKVVNDIES